MEHQIATPAAISNQATEEAQRAIPTGGGYVIAQTGRIGNPLLNAKIQASLQVDSPKKNLLLPIGLEIMTGMI